MSISRVVVVEDDQSIREAFQRILEIEGYDVNTFSNGKEALDGLKNSQEPCLILLDWMMPIMSGGEFLEARSKASGALQRTPVVVISAEIENAAGAPGVLDWIDKPFDIGTLLDTVKRHCDKSRSIAA